MIDKFQNKYRITSARLANWDYSWNGAYFITICTKNREHYFGEIINGKMQLSNVGIIANLLWSEIVNHTINIELGEFVIMPNHVHGILILDNDHLPLETLHATSLRVDATSLRVKMSNISPKPNSISTIIRSYKSAVTKHVNRLDLNFAWQARFHDHIIRNDKSFQKISNYIKNNPYHWKEDKFFD